MYICEYCGKEFDNYHKLGGHKTHCEKNPNIDNIKLKLKNSHKKINQEHQHLHCKYCNKEVANQGCLVLHERHCKENPDRTECKGNYGKTKGKPCSFKGETKETREFLRKQGETYHNNYVAGKFKASFEGKTHTEETKRLISKNRKKYLQEHKDEHVWKRNDKFISVPCEYLKDELRKKNIKFVEEFSPFDDYNYSVDIAWPNEKIGIEVNGNQHYNNDGTLTEYYQKRHNIFEERGWKLYEIHYTKCYKLTIETFEDIINLKI